MDSSALLERKSSSHSTSTAVMLTLTGPVAGITTYRFERHEIGKRITVGPAPTCDWQIVASGVFPVVLMFTGECLWVAIEQVNRLAVHNGATLQQGWSQLEHGDRLELGVACIQVSLASDLRTADQRASVHPATRDSGRPSAPLTAIMRLVRGTSERNAWLFRANDLGASVSLGAGKHCDWPMSTGGFEIREVTLLCAGGTLLARREQPGNRIRLNGEPMGDDWTFISPGSRLEVGLACVELQFAAEHRPSLPPLAPGMRLARRRSSSEALRSSPTPVPTLPAPSLAARSAPLITPPPVPTKTTRLVVQPANHPAVPAKAPTREQAAHQTLPMFVANTEKVIVTQSARPAPASAPVTRSRKAKRAQARARAKAEARLAREVKAQTSASLPQLNPALAKANLVLRGGGALSRVTTSVDKQAHEAQNARARRNAVAISRESLERGLASDAWVQACVPTSAKRVRKGNRLSTYALSSLVLAVLYVGWLVLLEQL